MHYWRYPRVQHRQMLSTLPGSAKRPGGSWRVGRRDSNVLQLKATRNRRVLGACSPPPCLPLTTTAHPYRRSPPLLTTAAPHHRSPPPLTTTAHHRRSPPPLTTAAHHHGSPPPLLATTAHLHHSSSTAYLTSSGSGSRCVPSGPPQAVGLEEPLATHPQWSNGTHHGAGGGGAHSA